MLMFLKYLFAPRDLEKEMLEKHFDFVDRVVKLIIDQQEELVKILQQQEKTHDLLIMQIYGPDAVENYHKEAYWKERYDALVRETQS